MNYIKGLVSLNVQLLQARIHLVKELICFYAGIEPNFKKYSHQEADTLGLPYDYKSVMHYTTTSGSKNGQPTILAIGKKDLQLGSSGTLTPTDILQINRLYECESKFSAPLWF